MTDRREEKKERETRNRTCPRSFLSFEYIFPLVQLIPAIHTRDIEQYNNRFNDGTQPTISH